MYSGTTDFLKKILAEKLGEDQGIDELYREHFSPYVPSQAGKKDTDSMAKKLSDKIVTEEVGDVSDPMNVKKFLTEHELSIDSEMAKTFAFLVIVEMRREGNTLPEGFSKEGYANIIASQPEFDF